MIKVGESVILRDFLGTSKYTCIYLRNEHPHGSEVLNMNEAISESIDTLKVIFSFVYSNLADIYIYIYIHIYIYILISVLGFSLIIHIASSIFIIIDAESLKFC